MENDLLKGKTILIVEDDLSSRLYLNKILEKTGMTLHNATNGAEAVATTLNTPGIDIILMDIQLPLMDGFTALRKIRESGINTVIIAQTAYGLSDDKEKIIAAGFNDYVIKPILSQTLIDKIVKYLK